MTKDKMYYHSTNTEIKLGDKIFYKKIFSFKKTSGTVVYIPNESVLNKNMEFGDTKQWGVRLDNDPHTIITMGYYPEEETYALKRISFVNRGDPTKGISENEELL